MIIICIYISILKEELKLKLLYRCMMRGVDCMSYGAVYELRGNMMWQGLEVWTMIINV